MQLVLGEMCLPCFLDASFILDVRFHDGTTGTSADSVMTPDE
jgi:hypothetical protein